MAELEKAPKKALEETIGRSAATVRTAEFEPKKWFMGQSFRKQWCEKHGVQNRSMRALRARLSPTTRDYPQSQERLKSDSD
jgi:hypothetical protein